MLKTSNYSLTGVQVFAFPQYSPGTHYPSLRRTNASRKGSL